MNNMLIISQDGLSVHPTMIGLGHRQEVQVIGDKVKELLEKKELSVNDLVNIVGNSYRKNVERIVKNQEIPTPKMIEKLENVFGVEKEYFKDKELTNMVCVQGGIVVGRYDTDARALEVKEELQRIQKDAFINNKKVVYEMPDK